MEAKQLPKAVADKVQRWAGSHSVLHFWESDETYYIVVRARGIIPEALMCLRVFPVGGEFLLSQDNVIDLDFSSGR